MQVRRVASKTIWAVWGVAAVPALLCALPAAALTYRVTPVYVPPSVSSYPVAMNERGDVAGVAQVLGPSGSTNVGFITYATQPFVQLPEGSIPVAINPVGWASVQQDSRAYRYRDGVMEAIPTPSGFRAAAGGINLRGDVVGWIRAANGTGLSQPFVYFDGTFSLDLFAPDDSRFVAITAFRRIVGYRASEDLGLRRVTTFESGIYADVGPPGAAPHAVNDYGSVAASHASRAILISSDGEVRGLGTVPEFRGFGSGEFANYYPAGINNYDVIVGTALVARGFTVHPRAWIYNGGKMQDLSAMVDPSSGEWDLKGAAAVNDQGQIVAQGCNVNGCHVVRLDPVSADVIEYRNQEDFPTSPGGHFFYTNDPVEIALLDEGVFGRFVRTGKTFGTGGPIQVCRFYGSVWPGPNSHFYAASDAECQWLKSLQLTPVPTDVQQWNYEGAGFSVFAADTGFLNPCPANSIGVYRAYNNAYPKTGPKNPWDSNHRLSTDFADMRYLVETFGWSHEGVVFCSAQK